LLLLLQILFCSCWVSPSHNPRVTLVHGL
jgi:hypothetical protein